MGFTHVFYPVSGSRPIIKKGVTMASAISTVLIDANEVFREGLRQVLANTPFQVKRVSGTLNGALLKPGVSRGPHLFLVGVTGSLNQVLEYTTRLKASNHNFKLVMLGENCPIEEIASAFRAGASGYLSKQSTGEALIKSLELIMLGGFVLYTEAVGKLFDPRTQIEGLSAERSFEICHGLSERQLEILRCLEIGESNKGIAQRCGITEGTVKVHIKTILQKISVKNRTQAAIWACENVPSRSWPGSRSLYRASPPPAG